MLKNVRQSLIRQPHFAAKTIGKCFHFSALERLGIAVQGKQSVWQEKPFQAAAEISALGNFIGVSVRFLADGHAFDQCRFCIDDLRLVLCFQTIPQPSTLNIQPSTDFSGTVIAAAKTAPRRRIIQLSVQNNYRLHQQLCRQDGR